MTDANYTFPAPTVKSLVWSLVQSPRTFSLLSYMTKKSFWEAGTSNYSAFLLGKITQKNWWSKEFQPPTKGLTLSTSTSLHTGERRGGKWSKGLRRLDDWQKMNQHLLLLIISTRQKWKSFSNSLYISPGCSQKLWGTFFSRYFLAFYRLTEKITH